MPPCDRAAQRIAGVIIVTFLLTRALPGDPAAYFGGPAATTQAIEEILRQLGLDRSLLRYGGLDPGAGFDPMTRDRFLAGALMPAAWVLQAQRLRAWYREQALALFRDVDILLAPATPCGAPLIGQEMIDIDGTPVLYPAAVLYRAADSFIGLPSSRHRGAARHHEHGGGKWPNQTDPG
jgi:Asp-tRNA(Asn)/Glu-tRNA(Gln) amidotransferase A subunit family amidase